MKKYTHDEAIAESLEYFKGDTLAANVFVTKYALKDSFENLYESNPDQMHWRIAREIARMEKKYPNPMTEEEIYDLLKGFKHIVPQGGPATGIGNNFQVASLSNCFVIGDSKPGDSYSYIFKIDQEQVQIMKRRGGSGHDLSHLRPAKTPVMNSALTSTGIVPFMERYSNSTREVAQDGRRGALMLTLDIKHPDAEAFIDAKTVEGKVTGANCSIKISDEFMKCVQTDDPYIQQFPIDAEHPMVTKEIIAKNLWKKIIHNAWQSAEPGVLFWDNILRESPADCYHSKGFRTISTNPCGEIPLCEYDSCRLIAINQLSYVENPFTKDAKFNWIKFKKHAKYALRFMDDIIDLELEKIDKILAKIDADPESEEVKAVERNLWTRIKDMAVKGRRTGIGITAEGDMLAALGHTYGTDESIDFAKKVQKSLAVAVYESSILLASERGCFPVWDKDLELNNPFICRILPELNPDTLGMYYATGRRNISCLTIAPTGTTSLMTQTTSGVEPIFLPTYKRRRKVNHADKNVKVAFVDEQGDAWEEYYVFHHGFKQWAEVNGYTDIESMNDDEMAELLQKSPYYKATANDIDWVQRVKLQGALQKWVDHSISSTVNLPEDAKEETVAQIYETAWKSGCKGVTIYRDGCRAGVLVGEKKKKTEEYGVIVHQATKRPKELECDIHHVTANSQKWIVLIGIMKSHQDGVTENRPYEVFAFPEKNLHIGDRVRKGKLIKIRKGVYNLVTDNGIELEDIKEFFEKNEQDALTRMISIALRTGSDIKYVHEQLDKSEGSIVSFTKAISRTLKKYLKDVAGDKKCPSCGDPDGMQFKEGCMTCKSCGWSKCS